MRRILLIACAVSSRTALTSDLTRGPGDERHARARLHSRVPRAVNVNRRRLRPGIEGIWPTSAVTGVVEANFCCSTRAQHHSRAVMASAERLSTAASQYRFVTHEQEMFRSRAALTRRAITSQETVGKKAAALQRSSERGRCHERGPAVGIKLFARFRKRVKDVKLAAAEENAGTCSNWRRSRRQNREHRGEPVPISVSVS